jgi:prepilin-type N-terminal cleavage/methylation domain-containing protein
MPRPSVAAGRGGRRRGFTLIELMIAVVLFAIVGGALLNLFTRQQRFYRTAHEVLADRAQLRYAGSLLPTDLRPVFPGGGDLYAWRDTMLEFRQVLGSSVICRSVPVGATHQVVLPPRTLSRNSVLTSWLAQPEPGDSILVYDEGDFVGNADDVWRAYGILSVATTTGAAGCNGFLMNTGADLASTAFVLTVNDNLRASIIPGAPLRIFRRARYSFFRQPRDGKWFLGYADCLAGRAPVCAEPTVVSGPYRPYAERSTSPSGLVFTYRDATGALLVPGVGAAASIARVDVTLRTETSPTATHGGVSTKHVDSLQLTIGLRNR